MRPRSFFEKVWSEHVIADLGDNTSLLQVDRMMLHDQGGTALRRLRKSGRKPASPAQVFTVFDHVIETRPGRGKSESPVPGGVAMIEAMREMSKAYGFTSFDVDDPGQGVIHVVSPEQGIALPGLTLVCPDSHTCTVGGVGTIGWAVGASEGEHILATQALPMIKPKTMRINLSGTPPEGISAKDIILHVIGRLGANGGIGFAIEFAGPTVARMPIEARLTLCNMAIDFSANFGFVAPDDTTFEYLAGRPFAPHGALWDRALAHWRTLPGDPGACFDCEHAVECGSLAPYITWGTGLDHVISIDENVPDPLTSRDPGSRAQRKRSLEYMGLVPGAPIKGISIDAAYIGSCTNSRLSDLRAAADILNGRKVAAGVTAICVPGSTPVKRQAEAEGLDRIFRDAGFEWHEAGCGLCCADGRMTFAGKRVVSTTNRSFEHRQGPRTRTHLASPATVAASAVAGHIADPREFVG